MIEIDPAAKVSPLADIEDSVRGSRIVVGAHSVIDSFVKVKPAGGSGDVVIGRHCVINSGCVLYTGNGILIGDHVSIAANCTFAPVNHEYRSRDRLIRQQGFAPGKGGIVIEDDVWIGANCTITAGVTIRSGAIVAANSVVTRDVGPNEIVGGTPARLIRHRSSTPHA